ncbi:hypothetical protein FHR92_001542 [Fontibacillus solani]|uniref:Uncharacterized protein n=2 Tax=Fontibacillus TaxID=995014 RepID=A0A1G7KEP9_9BACL|nr:MULTISPECIES: hypothetical protein [Fontibacillus]MBA9085080.1 hypothetical protein [Fontibacillus solani]SDF35703.1 hypothetical protein SAMN04488542_109118 [Fontibacillus panacisegetis]
MMLEITVHGSKVIVESSHTIVIIECYDDETAQSVVAKITLEQIGRV